MSYKRGDFVQLTIDGLTLRAMVALASPNGASLMVMFDGLLDGCVGMMPLLAHDDGYHNLMTGRAVGVAPDVKPS
jgi:hypothetical protein